MPTCLISFIATFRTYQFSNEVLIATGVQLVMAIRILSLFKYIAAKIENK